MNWKHLTAACVAVLGLAVGAVGVQAQVGIVGDNPTAVTNNDTQSTYRATVTTNGWVWVNLKVFLEGTQKYESTTFVSTSGPTYDFSKLVTGMGSWGMDAGEELDYRGKASLVYQPWISNTHDLDVTIDECQSNLPQGRNHWARRWA